MSRQNVDTARRGIDAYNRRDLDVLTEVTSADFEWHPALPGTVEAGSYRGPDGIARYLAEVRETWEEQRLIADEFRDLGGAGVLMLGRAEGRGRTSGAQVGAPIGVLFDFHGAKITRAQTYLDQSQAIQAAGLE